MVVARCVEPRPQIAAEVPIYLRDLIVHDKASPAQARGLIYRAIVRSANMAHPCPSSWVLALICGYDSGHGTVEPIKKLERMGMIQVERYQRGRRVKVCSSGKWTRACPNTTPHWRELRSIHLLGGEG